MHDDLDLRVIERHHDADPLFREALRQRLAAILDRSEVPPTEDGAPDAAVIDLVAPRVVRPERRRRWMVGAAALLAAAAVITALVVMKSSDDPLSPANPSVPAPEPSVDETVPATQPAVDQSVPATELSAVDATVPATAPPASPPDTAKLRLGGEVIVFESLGAGAGWDLAAQDPETGQVRKLVATDRIVDCADTASCSSFVRAAEWSADGRWMAFTVSNANLDGVAIGPCIETIGVWVKSALGDPRQLTTPCDAPPTSRPQSDIPFEELWTWSPVGARLAYARVDGQTAELFVVDPVDGSQTSLGTVVGHQTLAPWSPDLEWSPDGTRIAYSDGGSVYQVEVDGGKQSLLSDSFDGIIEIAWSPDGSQILVHDHFRYRIQVMNADGSDLHSVLDGEDACCSTAWSPQGDRIVYMLSAGASQVWTVSPDGSNPIKIFDNGSSTCGEVGVGIETSDPLPVWAPNGTQVGYNDCRDWVVANADGTGEAQPIGGFPVADLVVPLLPRSWDGGGLTGWDLAVIGQVEH